MRRGWTATLATLMALSVGGIQAQGVHHLWMEAESFGPLKGANFSFQQEAQQTRGSWSLAGPDTAASWTQGGESEFLSIAARADEAQELRVGRSIDLPAAGEYTLWVRYADYRNREETFSVRILQSGRTSNHLFGRKPVVDELDPMKLLWDWAYGWDKATVRLEKGSARIELYTTGPTEARRCVDCLCLTTDTTYQPTGREKPVFAAWQPLRAMQKAGMPSVEPLITPDNARTVTNTPPAWKIAEGPPRFLWNVGAPWMDELKKPQTERIDAPFGVDPPLLKDFLAAYKGKQPPLYSHPLSGPVVYIPSYPEAFKDGSPFLDWLARHPQQSFAILLNYGEPDWKSDPSPAARQAARAHLKKFGDRFAGFVAGENIAYATVDDNALNAKIAAAKSRQEVLAALREAHTAATVKKFSDYYGAPVSADEAWGPVISCLSVNNEAWTHALCDWGVKRIGHENTGNSPTLARRLAFLRGACRQFGTQLVNYQSCNLGDAATMFSREHYFYPGSSRYVLDNQYDVWAGAGPHWLLKDYLLWHLAGVTAFYNEQGIDMFWKPGGNSAGDDFPVQLSPKGKVAEVAQRLAADHPRGVQLTPIAFLLDEAHGYTQERFSPGAFGLDPVLNPNVLTPSKHEANLRGWFDLAYYPAPETQGEPSTAIRQGFVNGIFGDIFDVIVNAPRRAAIANTYRALIAGGEVTLTTEWGKALHAYVQAGDTLVVCADQFQGPGVKELNLPAFGAEKEAVSFIWTPTGAAVPSNVFRYHALTPGKDRVLAATPDGAPLILLQKQGKGQVILVGIPLGLGIDERPVPLLGLLLRHLTEGLTPVRVTGEVEWVVNRLDDGSLLVALFNNRGILKPQHGVLPTDYREAQTVTLHVPFGVEKSAEWLTETPMTWKEDNGGATLTLTLPAGAVRFIAVTRHK